MWIRSIATYIANYGEFALFLLLGMFELIEYLFGKERFDCWLIGVDYQIDAVHEDVVIMYNLGERSTSL